MREVVEKWIVWAIQTFITPHVSDVSGVIVLTSCVCLCVCVCVCLLPLQRANRQTDSLDFWHGGQVEEYLGQVCRSRSQVKGQGHEVKKTFQWDFQKNGSWSSLMPSLMEMHCQGRNLKNTNVQKRRGVFSKRMRFFSYRMVHLMWAWMTCM